MNGAPTPVDDAYTTRANRTLVVAAPGGGYYENLYLHTGFPIYLIYFPFNIIGCGYKGW